MRLEVIGPGFGRTGTTSLKAALNELGLGPCYHMMEVYENDGHIELWAAAINGAPLAVDTIFDHYRSVADWPACSFWKELKAANPAAKIVLTRRNPDAWFESMTNTILQALRTESDDEQLNRWRVSTRKLIFEQTFGDRFDRDHMVSVMRAHEDDVVASCRPDELLVFDVADGWGPLCAFLDVPVPVTPFPRANTAGEFRERTGLDR